MSEVKKFKIAGEIKKGKTRIPFPVEISAKAGTCHATTLRRYGQSTPCSKI